MCIFFIQEAAVDIGVLKTNKEAVFIRHVHKQCRNFKPSKRVAILRVSSYPLLSEVSDPYNFLTLVGIRHSSIQGPCNGFQLMGSKL